MWAYTLRRLLYAVPILLGVSMVVFVLIQLAPGDVVDILVPAGGAEGDRATSLRRRFGLDEPLYMQYLAWLSRLLLGDFGISFFTNRPVAEELFGALGNTLVLALPAAVLGFSARRAARARWPPSITTPGSTSCSPPSPSPASACRTTGSASCWSRSSPSCSTCCRRRAWASMAFRRSWEHVKHLMLPVVTCR